jgi:hypothetical protein
MILEHEQLLFKGVLGLHSVLVFNCLFPHTHELPPLELFEEWKLFDVIVGVSFNQPLPQRKKFNGSIIFVESQTFSRKGVAFLRFALLVRRYK